MERIIHPIFQSTPEPDAPLWRYMSFAKLAAMLQSRRLRFTRVDRFGDHFEGVWPRRDLEALNELSALPAGFTEQMRQSRVAASCWVNLPHESAGMWQLYTSGDEGVAIKTTFGKLQNAVMQMEQAAAGTLSGAAKVRYLDHGNDSLIADLGAHDTYPNMLVPFMLKNKSYEHENEVRALVVAPHTHEIDSNGCSTGELPLAEFIDLAVTNPLSRPWFEDLVIDLAKQHGLRRVERSTLHARTFWQRKVVPPDTP